MNKLNDFSLFLNEEPIMEPVHCECLGCDLGLEGGDKSAASVWNPTTGELKVTLSIDNEDNPLGKWYHNCIRKFNLEKKALIWAVTHGHFIVITKCDNHGREHEVIIDTPKILKMVLPCMPFIGEYKLYNKEYDLCVIRKGRVVKL